MTYRAKLAMLNCSIWIVMFLIFSYAFLSYRSATESNYRMVTVLLFMLPNISNLIILYVQLKNERTDERNKYIDTLSAGITMIVFMLLVFFASIALHLAYLEVGAVPISWLWYLGYGSVFMVFIVFNLTYVLVSLKGRGYEG